MPAKSRLNEAKVVETTGTTKTGCPKLQDDHEGKRPLVFPESIARPFSNYLKSFGIR